MGVGMNGVLLALAAQVSSDNADAYYDAATAQIDYLLGHNPLGTSFVTGYGTVAPENPHHRPSMVVGKAMNAMVVGGVNPNLEDSAAKAYCADAPEAKCYVDNAESYSTNEITIYWNSPLTYLLAMTEPREQSGTDAEYGDVNVDGFVDISDVILLSRYTAEDTTISITTEGLVNADLNGDGKYSAEDVTRIIRIIAKLDK
jgi:endoglucanase